MKIYIFLLLVLIIIYIYSKKINFKKNYIEPFYTLYLPYYHPEPAKQFHNLTKRYSDNKKYTIDILINNQQLKFSNLQLFLKSLIAYNDDFIHINLQAKEIDTDRTIIQRVNNENIFGIIPAPILSDKTTNNDLPNIRFVSTLWNQYVFIITHIDNGIQNIKDLNKTIIGVGEKGSLWDQIMGDIAHTTDIDYIPYYAGLREMMQKFYNYKINAILITDEFPSNLLNFIFYNFYDIKLIPLHNIKNMDFNYEETRIDLDKLPAIYIPKITDNIKYLYFNSYMVTYKFPLYLITNKKMDDDICFKLVRHIYRNKLVLDLATTAFSHLPIPIQPGAKEFYHQKGYLSYDFTHDNCMFTYGNSKCSKTSIKDKAIHGDIYYRFQ